MSLMPRPSETKTYLEVVSHQWFLDILNASDFFLRTRYRNDRIPGRMTFPSTLWERHGLNVASDSQYLEEWSTSW